MSTINPLDLDGPQFLLLYLIAFIAVSIAWAIAGQIIRSSYASASHHRTSATLDPYETAYLAGGAARATLLAVTRLVDRGEATVTSGGLSWRPGVSHVADANAHPIERALRQERPTSARACRKTVAVPCEAIDQSLTSQGLILSKEVARFARRIGTLLIGLLMLMALLKLYVGLTRDRPVAFLVFLLFITGIALLATFATGMIRTTHGDRLLRQLRREQPRPSKAASRENWSGRGASDLVLPLVALWGMGALAGHPAFANFQRNFGPGDASSTGSGCSSGGDGGGGCGGGCGGCGGD